MRRFAVTLGLVFQIGGLIACSVLGSFFLGMWLDRRLGSAPCLMVVLVMVGFALAVFGAYRLATRLSEQRQGGR
jgi:F0F1-type ATP synthase assembly protein I